MKALLLFTCFIAVAFPALAKDESESAAKHTDTLKLIHSTEYPREFTETVKRIIDSLRQKYPGSSSESWDEFEREVSISDYNQWLIDVFERHLTSGELRELNLIFGDAKKKALIDELMASLREKHGDDFTRAVQAFRQAHEPDIADEIIRFMQSAAVANYAAARSEIAAGDREKTLSLLDQADARVRARHRPKG